jgi:hypothetical protein
MESRRDNQDLTKKSTLQQKIRFLEDQLASLDHYLPEIYDYILFELDHQKRILAELEVQEHFNALDDHAISH